MNKTMKKLGAVALSGAIAIGMSAGAFAATTVARIGSVNYTTLSDAMAAVKNGQTIVLKTDITDEYYQTYDINGVCLFYDSKEDKSFTIDLDGHTVKESRSHGNGIYIEIAEDAGELSVAITNGSIQSTGSYSDGILVNDFNPSTATIVTLADMKVQAAGQAGVKCFDANLLVQSAAISGADDAIYTENSMIKVIAGTFTTTGTDSGNGAIAPYDSGDEMNLNFGFVIMPEAPAVIRPSDWNTSISTNISVLNFEDVKSDAWYYNYVYEMAQMGVISGVKAWQFQPNANLTREQFTSMLANAAGADLSEYENATVYSDVSTNRWSAPAIEWARANDIASGTGNGKFTPTASITRQEACVMLYKYQIQIMNLPEQSGTVNTYPDRGEVASWADTAVQVMLQEGVMSGVSTKNGILISPKSNASRAQACTLVSKLLALAS